MIRALHKFLIFVFLFTFCISFIYSYHWQSKIVSYSKLEKLLAAKEWMKADRETSNIFGAILRKKIEDQENSFFGSSRLDLLFRTVKSRYMQEKGICCHDLQTIDRLWSKYSNGYFGFTTQANIALSTAKIYLLPKETREELSVSELFDRLNWEHYELDEKFHWQGLSFFKVNPKIYDRAIDPQKVPGFLPSKLWILNEASGKIRYNIEDAVKDFIECANIELSSNIQTIYLLESNQVNRLKRQRDYFKSHKHQRHLMRKNCS